MKTIENPLALVTTTDRTSKAGKALGKRATFSDMTAGDLRKQLKGQGLSGVELTRRVNAVLCGEMDVRKVVGIAYVQHLCNQGFVPDCATTNKNQTSATVKLVKVNAPRLERAEVAVMDKKERTRLLALLEEQAKADKEESATLTV